MRKKLSVLLGLALLATLLCGFRPFAKVTSVCPKCKQSKSDVVVMQSGIKIRCNVAAQNDDYYVVERYGEYRAVPKADVASVVWRTSSAAVARSGDQVILTDGVVLHGSIVREVKGMYFIVKMGKWQHVAWINLIQGVYKAGTAYRFK